MGYALGCIRMQLDDFCALTPEEFEAVSHAYGEQREAELHGDWERMRMLAAITIQPHVKGRMTPERLLPFPWEKPIHKENTRKLTADESKKRFEELVNRT